MISTCERMKMTFAISPFISALRRGMSRLGGTMAAFLFSLALAGCGGGGGGSGFFGDAGGNVGDEAGPGAGVVLGSGEGITEERRQGVAVKVAGLDLGGEGKVRAEDVRVSEDPEILNQNPFATAETAPESVAEARGFVRQSVEEERKTPGYKAFEVAVPADNPLMTVAVWISETAPEEEVELPEGKPERDPEAPRKFLYVRLQVYVSTRNFAAVEGGGVEVLETQVIAVEERLPDPKPPAGADECEAAGWKAARVDGNAINCLIPLTSGGEDFEGCVLAGEFEPLCSEVFGEDFVFPTKAEGEARYVFNCGEGMIPEGSNTIGATQCFSAAAVNCAAGSLPANGMTQGDLNVALRLAARRGDSGQVCEMLRRGAEVNDDLNGTEFTALQEAVSEGHLGVAELLLANGAEVNARKEGAGPSALDLAARAKNAEIAAVLRAAEGRCFLESGGLCEETVVAGVCAAGTLGANGLTQAQLDANFLDAVWESEGETGEICEYLRRGANVEAQDETDRSHPGYPNHRPTGLMMAAMRGQLEVVRFLLDNGADPSRRAGGNRSLGILGVNQSALVYASAWGHTEIVRLLLDRGADVNMVEGRRRGGLFEASHFGRWDVVKLLLERGANPRIADVDGNTALHGVAAHGRTTDLMDMCKNSGCPWAASPSVSPSWEKTLRTLLSADVAVNARVTRGAGVSPLDVAVQYGHEDFAGLLRAAGGRCFVESGPLCEVAVASDTVCTAGTLSADGKTQAQLDAGLISAAEENDLPKICEHLRRGANVEAIESGRCYYRTPLMIAANDGNLDAAKLLHANGANVNRLHGGHLCGRGKQDWSPLMYAAAAGHLEMSRWLLDSGAEIDARWSQRKTALWEAAYWGRPEVVELLIARGAAARTQDAWGNTALRILLHDGATSYWGVKSSWQYKRDALSYSYPTPSVDANVLVISLLAEAGADVNNIRGGRSILDEAVSRSFSRYAEVLRGFGAECRAETGPLCGDSVVAGDTICTAGSLSANGLTQRRLNAGLISAARGNDLAGVCEYLRRGANVDAQESEWRYYKRTALMIAAMDGNLELGKLLRRNGADVNLQVGNYNNSVDAHHYQGNRRMPALHYAAGAGRKEFVEWLLSEGANVRALQALPRDALWEAAFWGRPEIVRILLTAGADANKLATGENLALWDAVHHPTHWAKYGNPRWGVSDAYARPTDAEWVMVISILVANGADVNVREPQGASPLDIAVRRGNAYYAELMREYGSHCFVETGPLCEVEVATPVTSDTVCTAGSLSADGMTRRQLTDGLVSATEGNDLPKICEYLRRGANVEAIESGRCYYRTPLMIAANDGNLDAAKLLHANGANVNRLHGGHLCGRGKQDWSPLMYAAAAGHLEMSRWLLDSGAEIDARWSQRKTALWEAAYWGRPEVVELLIARGAAARTQDAWGNTALRILLHDGATSYWGVKSSWQYKRDALSYSYPTPSVDANVLVISLLAEAGADVNNIRGGRSILDEAVSRSFSRYAEVLRGFGAECRAETGPLCGVAVATPEPVVGTVVASDTVCTAGSLSANGMTERQLTDGLVLATEGNDLPKICEYLRRGANVEAIESGSCYKRTPLMIAANDGNLDAAKLLHTNGANVNRQSGNHVCGNPLAWSALMYAAAAGHLEMARWLLDSGAEIEAEWSAGVTALWEAAYWGRPEVLRLLLSRGASWAQQDGWGNTALRRLLHDGAVSQWTKSSWQYKRDALSYSYTDPSVDANVLVISLLAEAGADVNNVLNGRSVLDDAVSRDFSRYAEMLRSFGAECRMETGPLCGDSVVAGDTICTAGSLSADGLTQAELDAGLLSAAAANNLSRVCEFLRRGANVDAEGPSDTMLRETALINAAVYGRLEMARLLLNNGADADAKVRDRGKSKMTALIYASAAGHADMVELLLDEGAEIDATDSRKRGAVYEAAHWGRLDVLELLLSRGVNAGVRDRTGETVLHGVMIGNTIKHLLLRAEEHRGNWVVFWGHTVNPDDARSWAGALEVLLTADGVEVNTRMNDGRSALDYAAEFHSGTDSGFPELAELLRNAGGRCFVRTGPLCGEVPVAVVSTVVASDTVCTAGSLPGNGMTQAQLDAGLIAAAGEGDLTTACEYLRRGANPNGRDAHQHVPLMHAKAHLDMGGLLLANGADKYVLIDGNGWWSPLFPLYGIYTAAQIEFYLSRGVDPNFGSLGGGDYDWRPLHEAAFYGKWNAIKHLLDGGAVPNVHTSRPGWRGRTPLHEAVGDSSDSFHFAIDASNPPFGMIVGNSARAVSVLLEGGAEVNARDGRGYSPLDRAAVYSKTAAAAVLRAAGGRCFVRTGPLCGEARVAVEYSSSANGTVSAGVESGGEVARGATVAFTATPAEGFYVSGWTGGCVDAVAGSVGDGGAKVCSLIAEAALSVGAVFAEVPSLAGPECPGGTMPGNGLTQAELNTQLRLAARNGDTRKICEMLRRGAEVNDNLDGNEFTALQEAVSGGHKAAAEMLLANDAHVNARKGGTGPAPLDLAAQNDNAEIAQILRDAHGQCFVETGPLCGEYLPAATLDPSTVAVTATTTATVAIKDLTCPTEPLSAEGATQSALDKDLLRAMRRVVDQRGYERACNLVRRGADVNYVSSYGKMPLHHVFGDRRMDTPPGWMDVKIAVAKLLIGRGGDVNATDNDEQTPLYLAVKHQCDNYPDFCVRGAEFLIDKGADVDAQEENGWTTLSEAAWMSGGRKPPAVEGMTESLNKVAQALIRAGADPNIKDFEGATSLHDAFGGAVYPVHEENLPLIKTLIDGGADVNAKRDGDWTPLHDAVGVGSLGGVRLLIDNGADVNAENDESQTPLELARGQGNGDIVALLEAATNPPAAAVTLTLSATLAAVPQSVPDALAEELQEDFQEAFNSAPAFGDAFGAAASPGRFLTRLDSLMRATAGTGDVWDSFYGWQKENDFGRVWFSTGQRGDFGFGAGSLGGGESGFGKVLDANPFAALSGNGMLAGGETGFGESGKVRVAAFGDYESQSLLSGEDGKWTRWAASGTAIETAMSEAERFSGLSENKTRGAMTEFHLGGADVGVALQAGAVSESESALGGTARNESLRGLRSRTAFAGLSGSAALLGTGWRLRGAAHVGRSWAESDGMLRSSDLWASAFSAGLERGGWLYSDDGFVLRFSQPLRVEIWERELANDNGVRRMGISPSGRQLDVDAAYRLPLSGGGWLLFSAGVRRDGGHSSGSGVEGGALFAVEKGF